MARAKALPSEYHNASKALQTYMWTVAAPIDWKEMIRILDAIPDVFKEVAADGKCVKEYTGNNAAIK